MNMDEAKFKSSGFFVALRFSPCGIIGEVAQRALEWLFQCLRAMYERAQYCRKHMMKTLGDGMGRHRDVEYSLGRMSAIAVERCGA